MRKSNLFFLLWSMLCSSPVWAFYPVHDSVTYVHNTVKAIQDELYQQMALDYQVDQLGKTAEILQTGLDTLKVTQDTYSTCKDMYDTAVAISDYIGDPRKLTAYMNREFWHDDEIQAALNITREAMDMADDRVANTGNIRYMLRQIDYALADEEHVMMSAPIISAYCVASVLWSRLFLKEKLSWKHYLMIGFVVAGIVILGIYDI